MVGIEDQVVALYARGMSTRDIQAQLADLYGVAISPALVSNITDKLLPRITEWQQRPLAACYPVVFRDAIHYKVREDGRVVTKAAYMVVGIDLAGYKDVLGMWIGARESATCWLTVLSELKSRGVQDILVVAVDNLTGFSEAIATVFPRADIQKCIVHQIRHALQYAARKDYAALAAAPLPGPDRGGRRGGAGGLHGHLGAEIPRGGAVVAGPLAGTGHVLPVSAGVAARHLHHEPP
jgi:putative transposase